MPIDLSQICLETTGTIRDAIACIDCSAAKVALAVDSEFKLLDTITDGDIRRAVLAGETLDAPVAVLLERKASKTSTPTTALAGTLRSELLELMTKHRIRQIPLLDQEHRVVGLATLNELLPQNDNSLRAVVMAGGYGTRLRPLTEDVPKPMLPVGDRPLLEVIIEQLQRAGIHRVNLTTHYKKDVITEHFGNGEGFGVDIKYIQEDNPLGTAGALALIEASEEVLLVINGDILTGVDFQAMLDFHQEHQADMTVAVREHEVQLPYGVIETDGAMVTSIAEKPIIRNFVNAGIYLLSPLAHRKIPTDQPSDMTDLIGQLLEEGRRVVSFPIHEYWLDIGHADDYRKAQEDQVQWDPVAKASQSR